MHIEKKFVQEMIREGVATIVPGEIIAAFHEHACAMPWLPTSIEWQKVSHRVFVLTPANENEASAWLHTVPVGSHSHVVVCYNADQPGVACPVALFVANIGRLFSGSPGMRLLFGAELGGAAPRYHFPDLGEFDGGGRLTAALSSVQVDQHKP